MRPARRRRARRPPRARPARADRPHRGGAGGSARRRPRRSVHRHGPRGVRSGRPGGGHRGLESVREGPDGEERDPDGALCDFRRRRPRPSLLPRPRPAPRRQGGRPRRRQGHHRVPDPRGCRRRGCRVYGASDVRRRGLDGGRRGVPGGRGGLLLRPRQRRRRAAARGGSGPQDRLRRRPGSEHRWHGRLLPGRPVWRRA